MLDSTLNELAERLHGFSSSGPWTMQLIDDALSETKELGSGKFIPEMKYTLVVITRSLISDIYFTHPITTGLIPSKVKLLEVSEMLHDLYKRTSEERISLHDLMDTEGELDKYFDGMQVFCTKLSDYISSMDSGKFDRDAISKGFYREVDMLKTETTFFYNETTKIKGLYQSLNFLLAFLKDSANVSKNHGEVKCFEKYISNLANRAEDTIEEKLLGASFESKLRKMMHVNIELTDIDALVQTLIGNIFDKEGGIIPGLYSTFVEIDSIKKKVTAFIDETLSVKKFLPETVSNNGSVSGLIKEDIVVGLNGITEEIVDRLTGKPYGLEILSITRMGGCGKTTLARKAYDHHFTAYQFYCRGWITISQVYHVRDLLLGLLYSIAHPTDEIFEKDKEQLAELLYRSLKGRRYLIVIDDIWSINAWDDIKKSFPNDRNGSRILLTSRLKSVVVSISPKWPPYSVSPLTIDESSELLHKKVFGKESCPEELIAVGNQVIKHCQGLPLAIVVVAGHLSRIRRTQECWRDFADNVGSLIINDPEQCLGILSLSYYHLPHNLKACYLYMGAFPEDCEIEVEKLINLWIAEGFLEDVAMDYLEDLIDRNLVLVGKRSFNGKVKTCRLHDLLRELCLREANKEKFMCVIKSDSQRILANLNNERRLSFQMDFYDDVHLMPSIPLVRSFLCFSIGAGFTSDIFFFYLQFKLLRVLDISFLHFDYFPAQILNLSLLKYLALTVTYEFPAQISELENLRTLIIHGPWSGNTHEQSPKLSLNYWNLPWLRYLHIGVPSCLPRPPRKSLGYGWLDYFGKPTGFTINLQTLSRIQLSSCTAKFFELMPYLKKLGISESKEDYNLGFSFYCLDNLRCLRQLEKLICSFYKLNTGTRRNIHLAAFPSTIKELSLSWSYLPWEDMTSISKLPNLEVLKLKNYAFQGPEWTPTEDGFHHLKHLMIEKTDLKSWKGTRIHFPILQRLVLRECNFLEIPFGIGEIPTLELIELHYCSKSAELSSKVIKEEIEDMDVRIQSEEHVELPLEERLDKKQRSS